jgi:ketosteroid isomerase-like protein
METMAADELHSMQDSMSNNISAKNEAEIRALIENWASAVRAKNFEGILANHSHGILMFDVPPPFQSKGIEAYKRTWDLFFKWAPDPAVFDILEMTITAGEDVAFAAAVMQCVDGAEKNRLSFRLTIGLSKIGGKWTIVHEHHSVPAE